MVLGVVVSAALFPWVSQTRRGRLRQRWSRGLLAALGITLATEGAPLIRQGLLVANHISWVDIFVVNALTPVAFVSKADVRQWPLIGWLAAMNETVFLRRGSRGHARIINQEIADRMAAGRHVALFPEGTTTDGTQVLHFHAALLQPAIATGHAIQPLALRYLTPEGRHTRAAAYDGDVTLAACLASIIATPRIDVHVSIAPGMSTAGTHRRDIATAARAAIVAHVAPTNADALAA